MLVYGGKKKTFTYIIFTPMPDFLTVRPIEHTKSLQIKEFIIKISITLHTYRERERERERERISIIVPD